MPLIIKDEYPETLFREDGKRLDGRDLNELRPIKMEVGIVPNADGSAYLEWGNNKIYAAVYGPREVHPHHLSCLLYTSPSPRDRTRSRMPSSA